MLNRWRPRFYHSFVALTLEYVVIRRAELITLNSTGEGDKMICRLSLNTSIEVFLSIQLYGTGALDFMSMI